MSEHREPTREGRGEWASAITVRLGMVAGGVLGGFAAYWIGILSTKAGGGHPHPRLVVGSAVVGFFTAMGALTWVAPKTQGAGGHARGICTHPAPPRPGGRRRPAKD